VSARSVHALTAPPPASVAEKPKLHQLDVLRGVCALLLVFYHADFAFPYRDNVVLRHGSLFVDFFFVLSGFIMFHNYRELPAASDVGRFIALRFFRIYPLHLALLLAFLGYECLVLSVVTFAKLPLASPPFSDNNFAAFLSHLTLLNGFNFHFLTFNFPAWSISVEFWTYILFAACTWSLTDRPRLTIAAFALASLVGLSYVGTAPYASLTHSDDHMFARCVFGFFLGALLRAVVATQTHALPARRGPSGTVLQLASVAIALAVVSDVDEENTWVEFLAPPAFALVILCFVLWPETPIVRCCQLRPLLFLGTLSYSLYMVHVLVLRVVQGVLRFGIHAPVVDGVIQSSPAIGSAALAGYVGLTIAVSSLTYRFIEDPGRRLGRALVAGTRAKAAWRTSRDPDALIHSGGE
jgi:peptidoglycan/LPS O-acetylase OafA/YrhL